MSYHKEFYIGSSMENDAVLAECQNYLNAERLLRSNVEMFKCKVPPIVLELTFYNLWSWDMPEKIRTMMPDLKRAVLPRKSKDWNCVWLSKMTLPDCERILLWIDFFRQHQNGTRIAGFPENHVGSDAQAWGIDGLQHHRDPFWNGNSCMGKRFWPDQQSIHHTGLRRNQSPAVSPFLGGSYRCR